MTQTAEIYGCFRCERLLNGIHARPVRQNASAGHDDPQIFPNLTDYALQDHIINPPEMDAQIDLLTNDASFIDDTPSNQNAAKLQTRSTESEGNTNGENTVELIDSDIEASTTDHVEQLNIKVTLQRSSAEQTVEIPQSRIKNDNPEWHSLAPHKYCQICKIRFNYTWDSVDHYVHAHPNHEVFPSRVEPHVAELLRDTATVHKCEKRVTKLLRYEYEQLCYFCKTTRTLARCKWIDHLRKHTGYSRNQCTTDHFRMDNVMAYLCDLCNYVRFDISEMENHLQNEHEHGGEVEGSFKEVTFLRFPESRKYRRPTGKSRMVELYSKFRNRINIFLLNFHCSEHGFRDHATERFLNENGKKQQSGLALVE